MSHEGGPTAQDPLDRKAMLLEQFNDAEAAPVVTDAPKPVAQAAATQTPATADAGRARDEAGKFLPKDKNTLEGPAAVRAAPIVEPIVQPEPWQTAPKSWKKELGQNWGALDPAYQRYVHEREQQMKASYDAAAPKAELADKISQAAAPYIETIRGMGLELPAAVAGLMKVDHELRTLPYDQKLQKLQQIAYGYGIDLTGQMGTAQAAYPPQVQNIQNELLQIKGQFQSFTQAQEAAQQRAALDEIEKFSKTAEHFDDVKSVMAQLLQSGMAEGIPDAYEKAIRLNPDLYDKIQSAKQATADAEKRAAADAVAKKAKAAAVSVRSATPGTTTPTNAQDRRSMLTEQFGGLSERL